MTSEQIQTVKQNWDLVKTIDPVVVGELFYNRLFEIAPELTPLFRNPMPEQSKKLLAMIGYIINKLDRLEDIVADVAQLAKRHVQYGVKDEHYTYVGRALLWTLEKGLGEHWNEKSKQAWTACYTILAETMINAAASNAKAA